MKNPKVGERCRIYNNGECAKPIDGTVSKYSEKSEWVSFNDDHGTHHSAHRTQLIRLKPKKKPEVIEYETHIHNRMGVEFSDMFEGKLIGTKLKVSVEIIP